ncbi:MAG: tRNA (N(6)-L-threonylcarbamoyladenosine(37)-C(2))-methylthiotransferase MtaB [Clostridia bacterium]|nr:tRNA (N(6)-L-threonylcarbamoyladenosine(37)-C(2))-methylthiotransferase MtaB [Clostridia bacterium]
MNIKASILTLGCRVNQYESDYIMQELSKNGVTICPFGEKCDIYIINTCSVTAESDRKSRQFIRKCAKNNPNAVIIVTGCFSQINSEKAMEIDGVDLVIGNNQKSKIASYALDLLANKSTPVCDFDIYNGKFDTMKVGAPLTRTRAFIKIEDGCDSKCAYCIIPYARGSVRSNPKENVINEVEGVVSEGCYEVVLTGIETAAYGKDFKDSTTLADLLCEVDKIDGLKRIRLGSLDPFNIDKSFVDNIKVLQKVMPHFHISMQSGCTKTLNAMRRRYNIDTAKERLDYLKESFPDLMLSADIIVGFPNETDEDFEKTYEFLMNQRFLHLHIFPYSKREGTPAAKMANQVPEEIKKSRLHRLEEMQKKIKCELLTEFLNKHSEVEVLFESFDGEYIVGHTPNFIEVKVKSDRPRGREFLKVNLLSTDGEYLYAKI